MIDLAFAIQCDECGWEESWFWEGPDPVVMPVWQVPEGWRLVNACATCPACLEREKRLVTS